MPRIAPDPRALPPNRPPDEATQVLGVPPVPPDDRPSGPPQARSRPWGRMIGATVVVFLLGLAVVTGLEWIKGSTLTAGQSGTSVGRVLAPQPADETSTTTEPTSAPESTSKTESVTSSATSSATSGTSKTKAPGDAETRATSSRAPSTPTPTPAVPLPVPTANG
jgi:hypothetical protein